jgi:N-acetylmuramoyl-L-alanine amidase
MTPAYLILHCSDTEDGPGYSWDAIRRYHMASPPQGRGWSDIGYHMGLERLGPHLVLVPGRRPDVEGSHCVAAGRNHDSLGLCVVGKFDDEPPSPETYSATVMVLAALAFAFRIPVNNVRGHREYEDAKTCPGLCWDLDRVRADVAALLSREPLVGVPHLVL